MTRVAQYQAALPKWAASRQEATGSSGQPSDKDQSQRLRSV